MIIKIKETVGKERLPQGDLQRHLSGKIGHTHKALETADGCMSSQTQGL